MPTVTTTAISGITSSGAFSGGNITGSCAASVTARGVCWSTASNPTVALATKTINGSGGGAYSSNITGLTRATVYYVRAYATNSAGTAYGNEISFTSLANLPTVTTSSMPIVSATITDVGGNVTSDGGAPVTARGVCWGTTNNPTIANSLLQIGSGTGLFTGTTGFTAGTNYYVRAYATNSVGTAYGSNIIIIVPASLVDASGNTYKTISINGNIWMQENLRVTKYENGVNLMQSSDTTTFDWSYYHSYNNSATNQTNYGFLYNGYVVVGDNICPTNWHVPNYSDWNTLSNYLGGYSVSGSKMTDISQTFVSKLGLIYSFWNSGMTGHDNSSRFYGRGGGYYFTSYAGLKNSTIWWTSTSQRYVRLDYNSGYLSGIQTALYGNNSNSFYIRCKKD